MKHAYNSDIFQRADMIALERYRIPSILLMENAGRGACRQILRRYPEQTDFLILCGPGNNGGDGFVVARHLLLHHKNVTVFTSAKQNRYRGDATIALMSILNLGIPVYCSTDFNDIDLMKTLSPFSVIIDALLGTGSQGELRGEVLRLMNLCPKNAIFVSLDIPTGVNPDTGEIRGVAVKSELTVTFCASKPGLHITPASLYAGDVKICDIGISPDKILPDKPSLTILNRKDLSEFIPRWPVDAYKGSRGTLAVIGGSVQFRGAPLLSALGALRSGCGLVVLLIPDFMTESAVTFIPEAIIEPIPTKEGVMDYDYLFQKAQKWDIRCDATVIGPGLKFDSGFSEAFIEYWSMTSQPLVVDAGGLDFLSLTCPPARDNVVITPHAGEAGRLLDVSPQDVMSSRLEACRKLWERYSATIVLKGANSLIYNLDNRYTVAEGSPILATAGSGDVLSGSIGAMLAAGITVTRATLAGTLLHATAGSYLIEKRGGAGVLAREIADEIGKLIGRLRDIL